MKCRECKHLSYMLDPWSDEVIRIVCCHLGTATMMTAPDGWDETQALPQNLECALDLGTSNKYCEMNEREDKY